MLKKLLDFIKGLALIYISVILVLVVVDVVLKYNANNSINVVNAFVASFKSFNKVGFGFIGKIFVGAWRIISRVARDLSDAVRK